GEDTMSQAILRCLCQATLPRMVPKTTLPPKWPRPYRDAFSKSRPRLSSWRSSSEEKWTEISPEIKTEAPLPESKWEPLSRWRMPLPGGSIAQPITEWPAGKKMMKAGDDPGKDYPAGECDRPRSASSTTEVVSAIPPRST